MRTRFYIEERRDAPGNLLSLEHPVFMSVSSGGCRILIATGIKADLNGWDENTQRMEALDLFCIMCFTGVRYSELQRLKKEDIREQELIGRKPGGGDQGSFP